MKLLLGQGLPRSTVLHLLNQQIEAVHVGDRGLATATDSKILDFGRQEGMVVVTLDADFHALLALSGVTGPSVIRIRIEGLRGEDLARLLVSVMQICDDDLPEKGRWSGARSGKARPRGDEVRAGKWASKGEYSERSARCATFSTASSLLCGSAHKPRPDGQFHRVAGSPGPFAITPATASLRPVFQSGAWSDATARNRGADRRS
jgi:predicted nuclease of predicted toxin-antitoxin system